MPEDDVISFTTLLFQEEKAFIATINMQDVIDFLCAGQPSVVMIDGVPVEYRFAVDIMADAQHYYLDHYPHLLRATLQAQGLDPLF